MILVRHKGFSCYGPRKSDEGADTDLISLISHNFVIMNIILFSLVKSGAL